VALRLNASRSTRLRLLGSASAPSGAFLASINANAWSAEAASPGALPTYSGVTPEFTYGTTTQARTRAGYDATGAATTYSEPLIVTKRARQTFPNQASAATATVALNDYVLASDTIPSVTNNSTEVMPTPIVNWVMTSRKLVGNTLRLGVTGNHWAARNGSPFACVIFSVTDGFTTVSSTVSAMTVSTTGHNDRAAVLAYEVNIDITSLSAGLVTANAMVYPWIGGSASVADSSLSAVVREFSPRVFRKDTALAAAPNLVYVASTGVDATGYVGTNATSAAASPCLTLTGAINRARAVLGTTANSLDGLRVRLTDGTWSLATSPTANTVATAIIIEGAPGATKATTILEFGAANLTVNFAYLIYAGSLTVRRAGVYYPFGGTAGFCVFENCDYNPNGFTGSLASAAANYFFDGTTFLSNPVSTIGAGTPVIAMLRGVQAAPSTVNHEGYNVIGCELTSAYGNSWGTRSPNGSVIQFNKYLNCSVASVVFGINSASAITYSNISFSQNLLEITHTSTSTAAIRPSGDGDSASLTHVLLDNNTIASSNYQVGRGNCFYDENAGTYRTHKFCRMSNTVMGGYYHKEDWFLGANGNGTPNPTDAPLHVNARGVTYGVGFKNMLTLMILPGTNDVYNMQGPAYIGKGSQIGTSQTVPLISLAAGVNFTNWQATTTNSGTGVAVAGAAGGSYTVPTGSALIGITASVDEVFPFDLAGVARTRGTIGVYA
jgi:hypothetical protein